MRLTPPPGRLDDRRRAVVLGLSALLFAAVFALRLAIDRSEEGILLFFTVPIALLAMEFELYGGLLGALVAVTLLALYGALEHPDVATLGYLSRVSAFLLIGAAVGALAARLRQAFEAHERAEARLAAEAARRESEGLKSAVIDAALDCVITIDHRGRVLEFNPAAHETFGYEPNEAIGRELAELIVPPELRERHRQALARCARTGEGTLLDRRVELTGMRSDGSNFPAEVTITRVPETEPPIFAGYVRDITERKLGDERARRQSREIAKLAEERGELVAQLLLAEERTRRRIAQSLHDDALQRLLAAHQELVDAAPGRQGVTKAHKVLAGTIDRLREAVVALHPVTLQLGDLETALNAIAREQAAQGGFRHTVRVEDDAAGVRDELVLSLARELLTNVAKHAGASRCSVSVTRAGELLRLEVADDGRGIPPGRPEAALRGGHIGLASAIQRVQVLGGSLEVSSGEEKGTVVRALIPTSERQPIEGSR